MSAAVLGSAVLHATWNALAKAVKDHLVGFVALNLGAEPVSLDGVEGAIVIGTDRARDGELLTGVLELRPCEAVVASA